MHVLFLCSSYPGKNKPQQGIFFKEQAKAIKKAGHKVGVLVVTAISPNDFLLGRNEDPIFELEDGIPVYRSIRLPIPIHTPDTNLHIFTIITPTLQLFKRYKHKCGTPDLIHAQNFFNGGLSAVKIKEKFNVPIVLTEHNSQFLRNSLNERQNLLYQNNIDKFDSVICVSNALSKKIHKLVPKLKIDVIGNLVDTDFFKPKQIIRNKPFIYLIAATFKPHKRVTDAIKAFYHCMGKLPAGTELWVCGSGPEEFKLRNLVSKLGIGHSVKFFERARRKELLNLYQQSDVILSTSEVETFGLTLLEAMACGKPVISTRSGGPEDFVKSYTGILVETGNIREIAKAMLEIYKHYDRFNSQVIRKYVVQNYSPKKIANLINNIYKRHI